MKTFGVSCRTMAAERKSSQRTVYDRIMLIAVRGKRVAAGRPTALIFPVGSCLPSLHVTSSPR